MKTAASSFSDSKMLSLEDKNNNNKTIGGGGRCGNGKPSYLSVLKGRLIQLSFFFQLFF